MDVKLPPLAEGVESGTVVNILVAEGQSIEKDQPFMELETQKAVGSIPAPQSGTVTNIHVKEGMEVSVGQVLISISSGETPPTTSSTTTMSAPSPTAAQAEFSASQDYTESYYYSSRSGAPPPAAPSIRKLARELGIELTRIRGSQAGGRIVLEDVRSYIQRLQHIAFRSHESETHTLPLPDAKPKRASQVEDFGKWGVVRREKMTALRRTVSRRMVQSWTTVPKIDQFDKADVTELLTLRKKYAPEYQTQGAPLTMTGIVLKAVALALRNHPKANASIDESANEIVFKDYCHIGVAVDTEAGLMVPVVRDVDKKTLPAIAKELLELTDKARRRKIAVEEMQGGSFTVSNQGSIGGGHFTPIIYAPQVAILGIGQGSPEAAVLNGKIAIRTLLPLCLAYDHRLLDGADAVRFLRDIVAKLEAFPEVEMSIRRDYGSDKN